MYELSSTGPKESSLGGLGEVGKGIRRVLETEP
jgi:hypothetical protein